MDINWLVQRLKNGESHIINDGINDPYQVNTPPTSLSIKAAQVIERLHEHINSVSETNLNLQRQLNTLLEEHELLRQVNPPATTSGEAGQ